MPVVGWVTVIIALVIVFFAALGLIRVVLHLRAVLRTLAQVLGAVRVVADRTRTVPEVVPSVNDNLRPVADFCRSI